MFKSRCELKFLKALVWKLHQSMYMYINVHMSINMHMHINMHINLLMDIIRWTITMGTLRPFHLIMLLGNDHPQKN